MKKIIVLTAAAALMTSIVTASGAYDENESMPIGGYDSKFIIPYFYMKAVESDDYEILRDGAVYVDRSELTEPRKYDINMEIFIKDESKLNHSIYGKVFGRSDKLVITSASGPVAKYGCSPYKKVKNDDDVGAYCHPEDNMMAFTYHDLPMSREEFDPWETTGENSDDYPLALFTAVLAEDAEPGSYILDYSKYSEYNGYTTIAAGNPYVGTLFWAADYSPRTFVHVSDKMLGDVDNDGVITESDAEYILLYHGRDNNKMKVSADNRIAGDVNGDEFIDDEDAELIMDYCLEYKGREPDMSLNEFIKSR